MPKPIIAFSIKEQARLTQEITQLTLDIQLKLAQVSEYERVRQYWCDIQAGRRDEFGRLVELATNPRS